MSDHSLFGLGVRSAFPLPELPLVSIDLEPDITIELGSVPRHASSPHLMPIDDGVIMSIDGVARFMIREGSQIIVDQEPDVPAENVRLYLLGSAMGALLHQRALLPLHANSVQIGGATAAFMGESGAGKSTLAAWFFDQGHPVIGDDVCVVDFDGDGSPWVLPGLRRLRLWKAALDQTGRDYNEFKRSYAGDDDWDKFDVPLPFDHHGKGRTPLAAIYLLNRGDEFSIQRILGAQAVASIFENTYRSEYISIIGNLQAHMTNCIGLAKRVPVFLLSRPWNLKTGSEIVPRVIEHARSMLPRRA